LGAAALNREGLEVASQDVAVVFPGISKL
jgi:hypothetical protein